ncbi:hypothetical protein LY76DRAFT_54467 [Colletotrichum caudatum]|nr:hypothetical protein LY76DRAFT_54467 [Colletotrichum caudatum]
MPQALSDINPPPRKTTGKRKKHQVATRKMFQVSKSPFTKIVPPPENDTCLIRPCRSNDQQDPAKRTISIIPLCLSETPAHNSLERGATHIHRENPTSQARSLAHPRAGVSDSSSETRQCSPAPTTYTERNPLSLNESTRHAAQEEQMIHDMTLDYARYLAGGKMSYTPSRGTWQTPSSRPPKPRGCFRREGRRAGEEGGGGLGGKASRQRWAKSTCHLLRPSSTFALSRKTAGRVNTAHHPPPITHPHGIVPGGRSSVSREVAGI